MMNQISWPVIKHWEPLQLPSPQHCRPQPLVHRPTSLGTTMGYLSIISDINILFSAIYCVYCNITGLDAAQQHEKHTTHNPLMAINPARKCQRWLGSGWYNSLYFLESPPKPCQAAPIPTETNPSHRETPKYFNRKIFLLILCKNWA